MGLNMDSATRVLLGDHGWFIECESPLEISLAEDPESRATGHAADLVVAYLEELERRREKRRLRRLSP